MTAVILINYNNSKSMRGNKLSNKVAKVLQLLPLRLEIYSKRVSRVLDSPKEGALELLLLLLVVLLYQRKRGSVKKLPRNSYKNVCN